MDRFQSSTALLKSEKIADKVCLICVLIISVTILWNEISGKNVSLRRAMSTV